MRLGFACAWDPRPELTWSHTPWNLRSALRLRTEVVDVGVEYPTPVRLGLKALNARRVDGRWVSMWKHSALARGYGQAALRRGVEANPCDVVLQVQDLAALDRPYLVLQDLSYDALFDHLDPEQGLVHFPSLTRDDLSRLRDRQRRIYQGAAGVLAMSSWFAEHLVRVSGVPAEKVHVVHPGASAAWTGTDIPADSARRRATAPRRKLLLVGKDFETKGGPQVVRALALLRSQVDPGITLTVVGPQQWPMEGDPPPGVTFLGRLPVDRLAAVYDEHDLFVMPSRFEGFGIALVEALSRGLPCIGRRAFAMPEIITPGGNGDLVETDDPAELAATISRSLVDDGLFERTAASAPDVRSHYSWNRAAAEVVTIANDVVRSA